MSSRIRDSLFLLLSMDNPASFLHQGAYGDSLTQVPFHQPLCLPPPVSSSYLYKARPQDDARWAPGSAPYTPFSSALLYPGSCLPLAGLDAMSGLGASTATDSSCHQGVPRGDFKAHGRDTHGDAGLKREEPQQREGKLSGSPFIHRCTM